MIIVITTSIEVVIFMFVEEEKKVTANTARNGEHSGIFIY